MLHVKQNFNYYKLFSNRIKGGFPIISRIFFLGIIPGSVNDVSKKKNILIIINKIKIYLTFKFKEL